MSIQLICFWFLVQLTSSKPALPVSICNDPSGPSIYQDYLITSVDGGTTWQGLTNGLISESRPGSVIVAGDTYFLGTMDGLYTSHTNLPVATWHKESGPDQDVTGIFPGKDGVYATSHWRGFYHQQPNGQWSPMHTNLEDKTVYAILETGNGLLYIGCESGIYVTNNHGQSWQPVFDPGAVISLKEFDGTLFACTGNALWRSTDRKAWFQSMADELYPFMITASQEGLISIANGPEFARYRPPREVMLSTDSGHSWNPMFKALPASLRSINDIATVDNHIYASSNLGIFRTSDKGAHWQHLVALPDDNKGNFYKLIVNGRQLIALRLQGC